MNPSEHFIVVGIDGSESSKSALGWAAEQAGRTGAVIHAVMTWHTPTAAYTPMPFPTGFDLSVDTDRVLRDSIAEVLGDHPAVTVRRVVVEGTANAELLKAAQGADLLVVGSRGHGVFAGMLLGSTSEHCVAHASCPVVVIPRSLVRA